MASAPQVIYYSFREISLGVFQLRNYSLTRNLTYTVSFDNGCGKESLFKKGVLMKTEGYQYGIGEVSVQFTEEIFTRLEPGKYTIKIVRDGIPEIITKEIRTFGLLEYSILETIEDLFSHCKNCSDDIDTGCLVTKMNYFMALSNIHLSPNLFNKFRCVMTQDILCSVEAERNSGKCEDNNEKLIALYYLSMYEGRNFEQKEKAYNYNSIYSYITANIINLR